MSSDVSVHLKGGIRVDFDYPGNRTEATNELNRIIANDKVLVHIANNQSTIIRVEEISTVVIRGELKEESK